MCILLLMQWTHHPPATNSQPSTQSFDKTSRTYDVGDVASIVAGSDEEEDDEVEVNMDTEDDEEADEAEELEAKLARETSASSKPHLASSKHPQTESNIEEMLKLCKPLGVSLDKVDV